uniref:Uncharacterized protein n=1 Tax=virus sp. ctmTa7 TaxID=2828255 RepID=A0A8S5RCS7_9VIRU|nr:MAG TPA: hypothetical protein [virus sp. ctmTa7]
MLPFGRPMGAPPFILNCFVIKKSFVYFYIYLTIDMYCDMMYM